MKHMPQTIIPIRNQETINTRFLGTLDPFGEDSNFESQKHGVVEADIGVEEVRNFFGRSFGYVAAGKFQGSSYGVQGNPEAPVN